MLKVRLWRKNLQWLIKAGRDGFFEVGAVSTTAIVNTNFADEQTIWKKSLKLKNCGNVKL